MCINPLNNPLSGLGLAKQVVKHPAYALGGLTGAMLSAGKKSQGNQRYGGGPNGDGSMS
jgi:hypothetical protein